MLARGELSAEGMGTSVSVLMSTMGLGPADCGSLQVYREAGDFDSGPDVMWLVKSY